MRFHFHCALCHRAPVPPPAYCETCTTHASASTIHSPVAAQRNANAKVDLPERSWIPKDQIIPRSQHMCSALCRRVCSSSVHLRSSTRCSRRYDDDDDTSLIIVHFILFHPLPAHFIAGTPLHPSPPISPYLHLSGFGPPEAVPQGCQITCLHPQPVSSSGKPCPD